MKKLVNVIAILFFTNIFCIEFNAQVIDSINIKNKYKVSNYSKYASGNHAFNYNSNMLFAILKQEDKKFNIVAKINFNNKKIETIGKPNSLQEGGVYKPDGLFLHKDNLYIGGKRLNVFNSLTNKYLYSVSLPNFSVSANFAIKNDTIYTYGSEGARLKKNAVGLILKIIPDAEFKNSKSLKLLKTLIPYKKYCDDLGIDLPKYLGSEYNKKQYFANAFTETIVSAGCFAEVRYYLGKNVWAANNYGTEVFKLNNKSKICKTITINKFKKIRKIEVDCFNGKPFECYSRLDAFFVDEVNSKVIAYYILAKNTKNMLNSKQIIIVKDFKNNTEEMYPISFIPLKYIAKQQKIFGINYDENFIKVYSLDVNKL